jgi:NAD(P)-dependent dehydrogenase (short-subunit alcohol dehydrogenase family)
MTDSPVALITGGSRGIGAAAARELRARGYRVAVTGRDSRRLERLSEDLDRPGELLTFVGDAADHDAVQSAVEATVRTFGRRSQPKTAVDASASALDAIVSANSQDPLARDEQPKSEPPEPTVQIADCCTPPH